MVSRPARFARVQFSCLAIRECSWIFKWYKGIALFLSTIKIDVIRAFKRANKRQERLPKFYFQV
jgi:hypothetical protein